MKCNNPKCGREIKPGDAVVERYEHGILTRTWCLPCYKKTRVFRKATDYNSFDNYRTSRNAREK